MTRVMKHRVIRLDLGLWEDNPNFDMTDDDIMHLAVSTFKGSVGGVQSTTTSWPVYDDEVEKLID